MDVTLELVLRATAALLGHVLHGRDAVQELAAAWTWSAAVWPVVGLAAVALLVGLLVGLWTVFWDD